MSGIIIIAIATKDVDLRWNLGQSMGARNRAGIGLSYIIAGLFKQSMGARNPVGIGLSYRASQPSEIGSLESILGLLKSFKIRACQAT